MSIIFWNISALTLPPRKETRFRTSRTHTCSEAMRKYWAAPPLATTVGPPWVACQTSFQPHWELIVHKHRRWATRPGVWEFLLWVHGAHV